MRMMSEAIEDYAEGRDFVRRMREGWADPELAVMLKAAPADPSGNHGPQQRVAGEGRAQRRYRERAERKEAIRVKKATAVA